MERGCNFVFLFLGGSFGPWEVRCFCFVFFVFVGLSVCSVLYLMFVSDDHFSTG